MLQLSSLSRIEALVRGPHDDNLSLRISPTRRQTGLNLPTFSGFGQFAATSCPLGNRPTRPFSTTDRPKPRSFGSGATARAVTHIDWNRSIFDEILDALACTVAGSAGDPHRLAQERGLLAAAFDQVDVRAGDIGQRAGNHHARKPAAGAEIGPDPRVGRQREKLQQIGHMAGPQRRLRSRTRSGSFAAASARSVATKRSSRCSVSRETGVSAGRGRGQPKARGSRRGRDGARPGSPGRLPPARHAAPRLALRSCRRICATSKVSAAGVMPSIRPAWPMVRGRCACSLWRTSFDSPGSARIVDIVGEDEAFVAAIRFHVGRLAAEIDLVFGVDFELLGDLRVELGEARPDPRQVADADIRIGQKLEGRAALAVLAQREAISSGFARRHASGPRHRPRRVRARPSWPDALARARHRRSPARSPCRSAADRHCRRAASADIRRAR